MYTIEIAHEDHCRWGINYWIDVAEEEDKLELLKRVCTQYGCYEEEDINFKQIRECRYNYKEITTVPLHCDDCDAEVSIYKTKKEDLAEEIETEEIFKTLLDKDNVSLLLTHNNKYVRWYGQKWLEERKDKE